jgi:hypothetical protein
MFFKAQHMSFASQLYAKDEAYAVNAKKLKS